MSRQVQSVSDQRGFVLFELLLSAAVALLIMVWAGQTILHRVNDASAQQSARWMLMVRSSVHSYLEQHGDRMRLAVSPADLLTLGYQDWTAPSLAELKADGLLAAGFPERVRPIDGVQVHVRRQGDCPGSTCRIDGIIVSLRAFSKPAGVVDEHMLAQWLLAAEGLGGIVHPSQPDLIRGHTFSYSNPPDGGAILQPGTVVMAISHDQLSETAYLRVRDKRDPQFQSDMTVLGGISAGDVVSAGKHLHLGSTANLLDACPSDGAVTRNRGHGLLVCSGGAWQEASRSPGGYSLNSNFQCSNPQGRSSANPVTGACSCPLGYSSMQISEYAAGAGVTRGYLCVR